MKQYKIINACKTMDRIIDFEIPFSIKNKIFKFRKLFQNEWDFQDKQEKDLIAKAKKETIDGQEIIPQSEIIVINEKLSEIADIDIDTNFEPVKITVTKELEQPLSKLTNEDLTNLDGFIEFE